MHRRLTRALLIVTLLGTLLIPAIGSWAGPEQKLENTQDELDRLQQRIDSNSEEAKTLQGDINDLNRDITRLQIAINELDRDIAAVQSDIRSAEARIADYEAQIAAVRERATKQAVELYKSGGTESIDALLDATSISELNDRIEMLGVAAEENTGALVEYSRIQALIEDEQRDLFNTKQDLDHKLASQSKLRDDIADKKAQLAERLTKVRTQLTHDKHREGDLLAASRGLRDEIIENQAKSSVAALGTSGRGFIWPLNGGITSGYGARWGSMHTGIDIDGYTGQPIVAAKEGQVILASSYSGYGNAVIIDHGGGISTLYAHMSAFKVSGGSVRQGQVIGYVGCTGSCTGDHLHFEVRVNGNPVDPMPYLP